MENTLNPDYTILFDLKKEFESFEPVAYKDTGNVWTIGFGSTYNFDKKRKIQKGDVIGKSTAIRWMILENAEIKKQIEHYISKSLNKYQSTAILDYVYNRGIGNFLSTQLDELINKNPDNPAIKQEIISTGLTDRMKNLLWGLGRRRRTQAHLYFTGVLKTDWPRWGKI